MTSASMAAMTSIVSVSRVTSVVAWWSSIKLMVVPSCRAGAAVRAGAVVTLVSRPGG
jgi:hypothetical protein